MMEIGEASFFFESQKNSYCKAEGADIIFCYFSTFRVEFQSEN